MKKGQVTIFIILGVLIVSAVVVFFLYVQPRLQSGGTGKLGFEGCVEDAIKQSVSELESSVGILNPELTYMYDGREYVYLCYTEDNYKTCVVQKPFLKQEFEESVREISKESVKNCYDSSLSELKSRGYEVTSGKIDYNVSLELGRVLVDINAPTTIGSSSFKKFSVAFNSPIYEMIMLATSIVQFETGYGDADTDSLRGYYPDYMITKLKRGDGTTIYNIKHKELNDEISFASKSLVWPAGFG